MVEWKKLESFADITIGEFVHKDKQDSNALYPVYNGGISNTGFYESFNNEGNRIVISARGANAGYVNRVFVKYWAGNSCYSIFVDQKVADWNFIYYYLKNNELKLIGVQQKGGIPAVSKKQISIFEIPIPSKEEQTRIVGILDTFTASIANLKSQIKERRKQYEYYRDQLLDLEGKDRVEMKTLGEVCEIRKERIASSQLSKENYVSVENLLKDKGGRVDSENFPQEGNWVKYCAGDILIGNIRPYLRKIWLADRNGGTNGDVVVVKHNEDLVSKYLYYILSSEKFFIYYNQTAKGGKMPRGEKDKIFVYPSYIPSKQEQSRIVTILDQFESSIANLEAQLKEREKQYEYYRNQLLTFENPNELATSIRKAMEQVEQAPALSMEETIDMLRKL